MANSPTDPLTHNCEEGCDSSHKHRWEIEPHPYTHQFDVFVTDSDREAIDALRAAAENIFDDINPGDCKTITIRMNDT